MCLKGRVSRDGVLNETNPNRMSLEVRGLISVKHSHTGTDYAAKISRDRYCFKNVITILSIAAGLEIYVCLNPRGIFYLVLLLFEMLQNQSTKRPAAAYHFMAPRLTDLQNYPHRITAPLNPLCPVFQSISNRFEMLKFKNQ
jgi:hypothetical protein